MTSADRRALRLGTMVVVAAMALRFIGLPAYRAHAGAAGDLRREKRLLAQELGLIQSAAGHVEVSDSLLRGILRKMGTVFTAIDLNLAVADAENRVLIHADSAPAQVLRMSTGMDSVGSEAGLHTMHIDLQVRTDFEGVLRLTRSLEGDRKRFRIERLTIGRDEVAAPLESDVSVPLDLVATMRLAAYALDPGDEFAPGNTTVRSTMAARESRKPGE